MRFAPAAVVLFTACLAPARDRPPNILLITADDMNCDSVGAFGSKVPGTTPRIDALAAQGMRFERAHVTIAVCQPCRSVLMTGRYPHRSGGEGFFKLRIPNVPILPALLRKKGYRIGLLGKARHSTPYADFVWDMSHRRVDLGTGRSPKLYAKYARAFFDAAKDAKRPFFLMANSHDPHRPFYGNDKRIKYGEGQAERPSRVFKRDEVVVPGFLPDLPAVRREVAEYLSSVRRCDDTVGALLDALDASGLAGDTVVVFMSDHGMAFPFAKTNCYVQSTHTPLIVRWPEHVAAGSVNRDDFVSGIDMMPTLLEIAGIDAPDGIDGRSYVPLLEGEPQAGRDFVFTQFHMTSARRRYPMRCVLTADYAYIFNPWSDGKRVFKNESQSGRTFRAMRRAGRNDAAIQERVELFVHRVKEELFDVKRDPDGLVNLVASEAHRKALADLRAKLGAWMKRTGDPKLEAFEKLRR